MSETKIYFAIGQNAWGKGSTQAIAEENCRKNGAKAKAVFETTDENAYVDSVTGYLYAVVDVTRKIKG